MDKRRTSRLPQAFWVFSLLWASAAFAGQITPLLTTERNEYELGEPVVLRQSLDASALTSDELKIARSQSGEKVVVAKEGGKEFPPLRIGHTTAHEHISRPIFGDKIEAFLFLQPMSLWYREPAEALSDWASEYLSPGKYSVRIEQKLLTSAGIREVRSNDVRFAILRPSGRTLEAWNELTSYPSLLLVDGQGPSFPDVDDSFLDPRRLERLADFARRYIDTAQGQFAAVLAAFSALIHDRHDVACDLYPTIGRLIDLRSREDYFTWYGRFCYLVLENVLEEQFNPRSGLATMQQFESCMTATSAPLSLRPEIRRLVKEYEYSIASGERPPADRVDAHIARLTQRGELPTDIAARTRRHNIALRKTTR